MKRKINKSHFIVVGAVVLTMLFCFLPLGEEANAEAKFFS